MPHINKVKNSKMENLKLSEIIEQLDIWIGDAQFDMTRDFLDEDEKQEFSQQIQQMLIAKANLETIENFGDKIFQSAIRK